MNKLYIAWAILIPLVGCTGVVGDNSGAIGEGDGSATGMSGAPQATGSSGNPNVSAGSAAIAGFGGSMNPSGVVGVGGASANGGTSSGPSGGACTLEVLPATVQTMLTNRCSTCHGAVPLLPTLPSLMTYANLVAPAKSDPTKTNAVVSLARLQSAAMPMPPAPGAPATASEISALQDFITQGYPKPSCPAGSGGSGGGGGQASGGASGSGAGGTPGDDPLAAMPTCTSKTNWTSGNRGSASMNPGMACISCHKSGEGPLFSIAGTVYPTGHEPDRCNSTVGNAGARIVVIGADGTSLTLTPNGVGNFSSNAAIKMPYKAKVTYQGRERLMLNPQTSGDCNSCHGQNGAMMAPGRITVP